MRTPGSWTAAFAARAGGLALVAVFALALGSSPVAAQPAIAGLVGALAQQNDAPDEEPLPPEEPEPPQRPGEGGEGEQDDMPEQPPMCPGVGCPTQRG